MEPQQKNWTKIIIISITVLFIILGLAGGAYYFWQKNKKPEKTDYLVKVGDKEITKNDLGNYVYGITFDFDPSKIDSLPEEKKKEYLEYMVEDQIILKEAEKLNISVTDEEINNDIKEGIGDVYQAYTDNQKKITKDATRKKLLAVKVKNAVLGWREGSYLAFNFP